MFCDYTETSTLLFLFGCFHSARLLWRSPVFYANSSLIPGGLAASCPMPRSCDSLGMDQASGIFCLRGCFGHLGTSSWDSACLGSWGEDPYPKKLPCGFQRGCNVLQTLLGSPGLIAVVVCPCYEYQRETDLRRKDYLAHGFRGFSLLIGWLCL